MVLGSLFFLTNYVIINIQIKHYLTRECVYMKKILFGLVLVLFGIFSLFCRTEIHGVYYGLWNFYSWFPFIGVGLGLWGLLEKDK